MSKKLRKTSLLFSFYVDLGSLHVIVFVGRIFVLLVAASSNRLAIFFRISILGKTDYPGNISSISNFVYRYFVIRSDFWVGYFVVLLHNRNRTGNNQLQSLFLFVLVYAKRK